MCSNRYDVIVVGGGPSGITAAVQSARAGSRTLLVEKTGMLGGTATTGGIHEPGLFHAWGKQIIAGIGWELVCRTRMAERKPIPAFTKIPERHYMQQICLNPALLAATADEMLLEAGAEILFHVLPAAVERHGEWTLTLCTKTGLRDVRCDVMIDATGDANIVQMAGFDVQRPQPHQPGTLVFLLGGYDFDQLDMPALEKETQAALADGRLLRSDLGFADGSLGFIVASYGGNRIHVPDIDASTSEGKTQAELAGRASMMRVFRFLQTLPGMENITITKMAPECGIRETVIIHGKETITETDYTSGRLWPDALCYSFYPIDIHTNCGEEKHLDFRPLEKGVLPTIPRGALLPADSEYLIAAGRHIAGDHVANSAYRVQGTCMAVGQAAGAMAALSSQTGADPQQLPLDDIRDLLLQHNAIVPGRSAL